MKRLANDAPVKKLLVATLALALSVAPVSAGNHSSRSKNNDATNVLTAVLGLAALGFIFSEVKKSKQSHVTQPVLKPRRPVPSHLRLPAHCLRPFKLQQGQQKFYSNRCLNNNFAHMNALPTQCKDRIVARNRHGTYVIRKVYRPGCLHERGFRVTAHY